MSLAFSGGLMMVLGALLGVASLRMREELGRAGLSVGAGIVMLGFGYFMMRPTSGFPIDIAIWLTVPGYLFVVIGVGVALRERRHRQGLVSRP